MRKVLNGVSGATSRKTATMQKRKDAEERYVVRFDGEDTYTVVEKARISGDGEDIVIGSSVKVTYDKLHNKVANAIVIFIGQKEDAEIIEDKLSELGVDYENSVLSDAEKILLEHRQRRARVAEDTVPKRRKRCLLRNQLFGDDNAVDVGQGRSDAEDDELTGWEKDAHLSCGSAPSFSPDCSSRGATMSATANAIGTALQVCNREDELTQNYAWSTVPDPSSTSTGSLPTQTRPSISQAPIQVINHQETATFRQTSHPSGELAAASVSSFIEKNVVNVIQQCTNNCDASAKYNAIHTKLDLLLDVFRRIANAISPSKSVTAIDQMRLSTPVPVPSDRAPVKRNLFANTQQSSSSNSAQTTSSSNTGKTSHASIDDSIVLDDEILDDIYRNKASSFTHFCLEVFRRIYSAEEMIGKRVNSGAGKNGLSPGRLAYLKRVVKQFYYPAETGKEFEVHWKLCVTRLNCYLRRVSGAAVSKDDDDDSTE